jgi:hypothetical protein
MAYSREGGFIQVHSGQYPELAAHYSRKIAEWYAAQGVNGSNKPDMDEQPPNKVF